MPSRTLLGLSVGTGFDSVNAVVAHLTGIGLTISATLTNAVRVPIPGELRDRGRRFLHDGTGWNAASDRTLADTLVFAARKAVTEAHIDPRRVLAAGCTGAIFDSPGLVERFAEQTGFTVVSGFDSRDVASGGTGRSLTALPDFVLFSDVREDRLLVHLGSFASIVWLPAGCKVADVLAFDVGPGNRFLDEITALGTRGREEFDPGGTKAVQGRCLDDLLGRWRAHPFLIRRPPRTVARTLFAGPFVASAFEITRTADGSLHDLLCTATHFVAGCIGDAIRKWLPANSTIHPRRVFVSGGGIRNGFLWKLLEREFPGTTVERFESLGVPSSSRAAAEAAGLAALTLDGVAGNLPTMTGASGSRLLGRIVPGDSRNWATCTKWMAHAIADLGTVHRAA